MTHSASTGRTKREAPAPIRGKSGDFVHAAFRDDGFLALSQGRAQLFWPGHDYKRSHSHPGLPM